MEKKQLILTGRGCEDYAWAGALALQKYPKAELQGMSKARLPEFLETAKGYNEIVILGISLAGDAERLAKALKALKKQKVQVFWVSGFDFPQWMGDDIRGNLESYISSSRTVSGAAAEYFQRDWSELSDFFDEKKALGKEYLELLEASEYVHRNYQDNGAYPRVIRHIALKESQNKWSDHEKRILEDYRRYGTRELIGESEAIRQLKARIELLAPHDHTRVLILGESGTGKETIAWMIHKKSGRQNEPFIAYNCATTNVDLLDTDFRGHEKGAYTGAEEMGIGIFEAANGGTVFLDEIGDLPLNAQGMLLRILEEGRFQRVGKATREITVDVRVIAATNRNLAAMVREGKFRLDLYQRLSVAQLRAPSLKEHKEDIPLLAKDFYYRIKLRKTLTAEQTEILQSYDFPGNVRELHNLLERAVIFGVTDFNQLLKEHRELNSAFMSTDEEAIPDNLEEATCIHVKRVCEKYSNNISRAAEALGVSRNTVRKYLES